MSRAGFSCQEKPFGRLPDGRAARLFELRNASGFQVDVTDYGGAVVGILAPDTNGRLADVVLGFGDVAGYVGHQAFFGALIGRFGNRIARGRFSLDGVDYRLPTNSGSEGHRCQLHGGDGGFHRVVWEIAPEPGPDGAALRLTHRSADGSEGYPGNLEVDVTYTVTDDNELRIVYRATTDRATPVNLTSHAYFNLAGEGGADVLGHELTIDAPWYLPVDAGQIPTGERRPVKGTAFDFRRASAIGARMAMPDEQVRDARGFDHTFVFEPSPEETLRSVATVREPVSGRILEVLTTEPGLQFYSGNFLDGSLRGKSGRAYHRHGGLCLETQHFPDSPNHPEFPSTILRPGKVFSSTTVYRFGAKKPE